MNNKKLGTSFEKKLCQWFAERGYWVHFIAPDARGAQPFDIIVAKDGKVRAMDCKTCKDHIFRISRLEDNQILAFEKWMACGNGAPYIAVEHGGGVYLVSYGYLKMNKSIDLRKEEVSLWLTTAR